jgi:hypothetical protein
MSRNHEQQVRRVATAVIFSIALPNLALAAPQSGPGRDPSAFEKIRRVVVHMVRVLDDIRVIWPQP